MRLAAACLAVLCLAAAPAFAADDAASLDLSLPQASTFRNDPPGTWYGDTSGIPANPAATTLVRRAACPTLADGSPSDLTGSVAAGVGYSSRGGNSNWQGATLNYCKTFVDDDGDSSTVNMQLNVDQYDGPNYRYGSPMGPQPGPGRWSGPPRR